MIMKNVNNITCMTGTAGDGERISAIPLLLVLAPKIARTLSLTSAIIWNPVRRNSRLES